MFRLWLFIFISVFSAPALATREVSTANVRVLFNTPEHADYAQQVANEAERALVILAELFQTDPPVVTLRIEADTDIYNAFAPPLPRPNVALRALFPTESDIGFGARSDVYLLLVHELTHSVQLTYTERPDGSEGTRLGLLWERSARVPPSWFLEGIATWVESEFTAGGRNDDARTRGLLLRAALDGTFPDLTAVSLITYAPFPGGDTRYLFGAGFVDHLVAEHGFETILELLRTYNAIGLLRTFSDAWARVAGTSLEDEWQTWQATLKTEAEGWQQAGRTVPDTLTSSGWYTRAPVISPDGTRLAWVNWPPGIAVADVVTNVATEQDAGIQDETADADDAEAGDAPVNLENRRVVFAGVLPNSLTWLDENTLAYSRVSSSRAGNFSDLFAVNISTGEERQLTFDERARLPKATPEGCLLYVRNAVPDGSQLRRWCDGDITTLWQAENGEQLLNLAVSQTGQVAASLWRRGFVDLALWQAEQWQYLNQDRYQDIEPTWQDDNRLLFASDRSGHFDVYQLDVSTRQLTRLTRTLGGAFQPSASASFLWYVALAGDGYNIAAEPLHQSEGVTSSAAERDMSTGTFLVSNLVSNVVTTNLNVDTPDELAEDGTLEHTFSDTFADDIPPLMFEPLPEVPADATYPEEHYQPWSSLLPYGWLPTSFAFTINPFDIATSAVILGQDDSAQHSYSLNVGVNTTLAGDLDGAFVNVRYALGANTILTAFAAQNPVTLGLRVGVWPHFPHLGTFQETATGALFDASTTVPLRLGGRAFAGQVATRAGILRLLSYGGWQFDGRIIGVLSNQRADLWGYGVRGWQFGAVGVWSATETGRSLGAWANVRYYRGLPVPGRLELTARAGYRAPEPIAVDFATDVSLAASVGYRYSVAVPWRYGDGLYSLERLSVEPRVRTWLDDAPGFGADITVNADALINYAAPVSFGVSVGYAEGWWYRFGLRLPL